MRLIDADALKSYLNEREYADMYYIEALFGIIDRQPIIPPDEVRGVGKWIECVDYNGDSYYECSTCHTPFTLIDGTTPELNDFHYCPNCGARLTGGEND